VKRGDIREKFTVNHLSPAFCREEEYLALTLRLESLLERILWCDYDAGKEKIND